MSDMPNSPWPVVDEPRPRDTWGIPAETIADARAWRRTLESPELLWRPRDEPAARYIGELDPSHRLAPWRYLVKRAVRIERRMEWDSDDECFADFFDRPFVRALAALLIGDGNRAAVEEADPEFDHLAHLPVPRFRNDEGVW